MPSHVIRAALAILFPPARAVAAAGQFRKGLDPRGVDPLGLCGQGPVESVIKQWNRRVKGSEKFWLQGGAEAILQVRTAYLSEDDRAERYWARPRPDARAVGSGRLGPPTRTHQRE